MWISVGFLVSLINVVIVIPPLFGYVVVFPELYARYPMGRIVVFTVLTMLFGVQLLQYSILMSQFGGKAVARQTGDARRML